MSTPRQLVFTDLVIVGSSSVAPPIAAPAKDPAELLDYRLDFSQVVNQPLRQWDYTIVGSATLKVDFIESDGFQGLTVWLSGGTLGDTATIYISIGTATGQIKTAAFAVPVLQLVQFTPASSVALALNSFPLTWGGVIQLIAPQP